MTRKITSLTSRLFSKGLMHCALMSLNPGLGHRSPPIGTNISYRFEDPYIVHSEYKPRIENKHKIV